MHIVDKLLTNLLPDMGCVRPESSCDAFQESLENVNVSKRFDREELKFDVWTFSWRMMASTLCVHMFC